MHILIAEDDFTSRNMLAAVLEKSGHDVVATVNGAEAWGRLQMPDAPQMAILDWMMPEMDGVEVARQVRALQSPQPPYIIMLTTKGEKADIVAGLDAGADDYLAKPFDPTELQARIRVGKRILELQGALLRQATHDPLTGSLNRRGILDTMEAEIARASRSAASFSIGICDIDHFKQVNDTHGHLVGDDVLRGVVQRIQGALRGHDLIGRYGGEEFLVIAPNSTGSPEEHLYQRLCAAVATRPFKTGAGAVTVTVSIGVTSANGASKGDAVLAVADAALYRAKDEGRNRVVYASESAGQHTSDFRWAGDDKREWEPTITVHPGEKQA